MQPEPTAAKSAKAILDYNSRIVKGTDEIVGRVESFVKFLREMKAQQIELLPDKTRVDLKEALDLVTKMSEAAAED